MDVPRRVLVAVSPRLLSDAVRRTLAADGIPSADTAGEADVYEIAVVTTDLEASVHARTVIRLTGDGDDADGVTDLAGLRGALALVMSSGAA